MTAVPEYRLIELRAIIAFVQWESFRNRRWAYLDYAKVQIDFWRDRWLYHAGQLSTSTGKR